MRPYTCMECGEILTVDGKSSICSSCSLKISEEGGLRRVIVGLEILRRRGADTLALGMGASHNRLIVGVGLGLDPPDFKEFWDEKRLGDLGWEYDDDTRCWYFLVH